MIFSETMKIEKLLPFLKEDVAFFTEQLAHYTEVATDPTILLISYNGPETIKCGTPYAELGILYEIGNNNTTDYYEFKAAMTDREHFLKIKGERQLDIISHRNDIAASLISNERRYHISIKRGSYMLIRTKISIKGRNDKYRFASFMYIPYVKMHLKKIKDKQISLAAFLYPSVYIRTYRNTDCTLGFYDNFIAQIACNKAYKVYDFVTNICTQHTYGLTDEIVSELTQIENYNLIGRNNVFYSEYNPTYILDFLTPIDKLSRLYTTDIRYAMKILHQDIHSFCLNSIFCVFGIAGADEIKYLKSLPIEELYLLYILTKDPRIKYYIFWGVLITDKIWTDEELQKLGIVSRDDAGRIYRSIRCSCGRRHTPYRYHDKSSNSFVPVCSCYCIDQYSSQTKSTLPTEIKEIEADDVLEF